MNAYDVEIRLVMAALGLLWVFWACVRVRRWKHGAWLARFVIVVLGVSQAVIVAAPWDQHETMATPSLLRISAVIWHVTLVPLGLVLLFVSGVAGIGKRGVVYVDRGVKPPNPVDDNPIPLAEPGEKQEIRPSNEDAVGRRRPVGYAREEGVRRDQEL